MIRVNRKNDNTADVYIHGVIVDDSEANWIRVGNDGTIGYCWPDAVKAELDALDGVHINLHVASDGGDVAAGICIYNFLKNHVGGVTAYIDAWAASIASVIVMAADKIVMPKNTFLMVHNPRGGAYGEAEYLQAIAVWLGKLKDMIAGVYAENAKDGKDEAFFKELMGKETWFNAVEAAAIFEKVELADSSDIEAVAVLSNLATAPEAINAEKVKAKKAEAERVAAEAKAKADAEAKTNLLKILSEAYSYEEKN